MLWPWPPLRRGDLMAITAGVVLVAVVALCLVLVPNWGGFNRGFGPDWECESVGGVAGACIKKLPKPGETASPPNQPVR